MSLQSTEPSIQRLMDRAGIQDALAVYARGVDRGDWKAVRSTYHPDAYDDHGEYKGGIDGLIEWLDRRFAGADNSMHLLGNCLIEFVAPNIALVETYFVSRRLRVPTNEEAKLAGPGDAICRESWGRYVDRFERREDEWRVARRVVTLEGSSASLAIGGIRNGAANWGRRDRSDPLYQAKAQILGVS